MRAVELAQPRIFAK